MLKQVSLIDLSPIIIKPEVAIIIDQSLMNSTAHFERGYSALIARHNSEETC